jgi:hypothetical protein
VSSGNRPWENRRFTGCPRLAQRCLYGVWDDTLFSAFTYPDMEPNPLHALKQPLLEARLRRLRARSTDPLDREGELPGTCEFGFSSDRDDY